jgi:hypothetical protein
MATKQASLSTHLKSECCSAADTVAAPPKPKKPPSPSYPKPNPRKGLKETEPATETKKSEPQALSLYDKSAAEYYRLHLDILQEKNFRVTSKSKVVPYMWGRPFIFESNYVEPSEKSPPVYEDLALNTSISYLVKASIVQPSFVLAYIKAGILSQEAGTGCYYQSIQHFKQALAVPELMKKEQINWCKYRIGLAYFIYAQRTLSETFMDFSIDYLSSCLAEDSKLIHLDALLYRAVCYWYKGDMQQGEEDLKALVTLEPSKESLVNKIKLDAFSRLESLREKLLKRFSKDL